MFRAQTEADRKVAELEAADMPVHQFTRPAPSGTVLYHVGARHAVTPASRAGIPHDHSAAWEATRLAVTTFRATLRAAKRKGGAARWYKDLDVGALHKCIQRYSWGGTHVEVASGILSSTIIAHPFPNANHRTSIALNRLYLEAVGITWPRYDLRGNGAARFFKDTHGFFRDSKYLLQLLRHKAMVRVAHEEGYTSRHRFEHRRQDPRGRPRAVGGRDPRPAPPTLREAPPGPGRQDGDRPAGSTKQEEAAAVGGVAPGLRASVHEARHGLDGLPEEGLALGLEPERLVAPLRRAGLAPGRGAGSSAGLPCHGRSLPFSRTYRMRVMARNSEPDVAPPRDTWP